MWNAFVIVFPFKICSRSANPDLRVIVVLGLCCIVRNRAVESVWCRHFSTDVCECKSLSLIKKQKEGIGNIEEVLPHFYFLSSLKDRIMKSTEAWTSRKHHGCLWKSFHFPPFLLDQEDGLYSKKISIHVAFYSAKQKEWKMGWYREIGRGNLFIYFYPLSIDPPSLPFIVLEEGQKWSLMGKRVTNSPIPEYPSPQEILLYFPFGCGDICYNSCIPVVSLDFQRRSQTCASLFLLTPSCFFLHLLVSGTRFPLAKKTLEN